MSEEHSGRARPEAGGCLLLSPIPIICPECKPPKLRDSVTVVLFNDYRPSAWEQVNDYVDKHGKIGNKEVRRIIGSEDTLKASKLLKGWVERGLLRVANPESGTRIRTYTKPDVEPGDRLFSEGDRKQSEETS
jgi:hypothetical protein